jgi:glycine hydroxymethyltransferase
MVLSTAEFAPALDKGCPLTMGGPLPQVIAAKAVAFREAGLPAFRQYAARIMENSQALAASCSKNGLSVLTGGTDNHLFLINVRELMTPGGPLTGRQAESALYECRITLNRNGLPFDPAGPWYTSGLRIGTAAVSALGMGKAEMEELGAIIALVLKNTSPAENVRNPGKKSRTAYRINEPAKAEAIDRVAKLLSRFPVYPDLDLELLKKAFVNPRPII